MTIIWKQAIRGCNKRETGHQSVLSLNTKLKAIFKKMSKINRKTFWVECYSWKRYVNCVSPQRKMYLSIMHLNVWIDIFALSSYKHCVMWSSFEFQQKVDIVWNYQVNSKKLQTSWHRLFFNLYFVTPKKSVGRAACFSFHICRYMNEMIMSHRSLHF